MEYNLFMKKYIFTTIFSLLSFSALADNNLPATNPAICLANNIYHEASTQPDAGQVAVGLVVLNRVKDSRYPNSICEVVYDARMTESWKTKQFPDLPDHKRKYYPKRHQCQFSWYCDGKADKIHDRKAYAKIYALAIRIISGRYNGLIEGATHYHADYVSPNWSKSHTYIGQIADHIFYRWD